MDSVCHECGARYRESTESCATRFEQLLALDHSRQEPWGSRHGLAFAVFALQHPSRYDRRTTGRAAELLERVFDRTEALAYVVRALRQRGPVPEGLSAQPQPVPTLPFPVTIADLGEFAPETYAADLERWCRTTLRHLSQST